MIKYAVCGIMVITEAKELKNETLIVAQDFLETEAQVEDKLQTLTEMQAGL